MSSPADAFSEWYTGDSSQADKRSERKPAWWGSLLRDYRFRLMDRASLEKALLGTRCPHGNRDCADCQVPA